MLSGVGVRLPPLVHNKPSSSTMQRIEHAAKALHFFGVVFNFLVEGKRDVANWDTTSDRYRDQAINDICFVMTNPDATEKEFHEQWVKRIGLPIRHKAAVTYEQTSDIEKQKISAKLAIAKSLIAHI